MARCRDFTEGSIPRHLAVLLGPLLAASLFQQLYAIADALMIAYCVGPSAFAAAGIAQTVANLLVFLAIGFAAGPAVIVGRWLGARRPDQARLAAGNALVAGTVATAVLGGASALAAVPALELLGTPSGLMGDAVAYVVWTAAGLPVVFAANLFAGLLRAAGAVTPPFAAQTVAVALNIALDGLFMAVLGWGVAGAAAATVLAQLASAVVCLCCLQRGASPLRLARVHLRPRASLVVPMARLSCAASVQAASLYAGKILVQGVVNGLGENAILAYAAAMRIEGLAQAVGEAGQNAGVAVIAQNHGACRGSRARTSFRWLFAFMTVTAALIGAAMYAGAGPLLSLFSAGSEGAVREGLPYLHLIAVGYVLCLGGNAWAARFQGQERFGVPLVATTAQIYLRFALSLLWAPSLGLAGIALATVVGWLLFHVVSLAGALPWRLWRKNVPVA